MKRIAFLAIILCCLAGSHVSAQFYIVPQFSIGYISINYPANNSYNLSKGSGLSIGLEVLPRYNVKEHFALQGGIGIRNAGDSNNICSGSVTFLPVFAGFRWGKELYIEADLGYNIPTNSSGLGYVTGWFGRISAGIGGDNLYLGINVDMLHLFGSKTLSYVPAGYVASDGGTHVGVYLEYAIPIKD